MQIITLRCKSLSKFQPNKFKPPRCRKFRIESWILTKDRAAQNKSAPPAAPTLRPPFIINSKIEEIQWHESAKDNINERSGVKFIRRDILSDLWTQADPQIGHYRGDQRGYAGIVRDSDWTQFHQQFQPDWVSSTSYVKALLISRLGIWFLI